MVRFNRSCAPRLLRMFCPHFCARSIQDVVPEELREKGFESALIDLDNTLLPWRDMEVPPSTKEWINRCRGAGLRLCLVSNSRFRKRVHLLSEELGVPCAEGRLKPSVEGFLNALKIVHSPPERAVMIGDQLFTDVWGGNRVGLTTIWVKPMHPREFIGTKISRILERLIFLVLRRCMEERAEKKNVEDNLPFVRE
jgi:HAD superfamily phosphatase (TIGR01668 family)